jgi:hypothetical protein
VESPNEDVWMMNEFPAADVQMREESLAVDTKMRYDNRRIPTLVQESNHHLLLRSTVLKEKSPSWIFSASPGTLSQHSHVARENDH